MAFSAAVVICPAVQIVISSSTLVGTSSRRGAGAGALGYHMYLYLMPLHAVEGAIPRVAIATSHMEVTMLKNMHVSFSL